MATDPAIRELLTAALLYLDPRIVDKRTALNTILVEVGLCAAKRACSVEDIQREVDQILSQSGFLNSEECIHAIDDCIRRGTVQTANGIYALSDERAARLADAFRSADAVMGRVQKGLAERIEFEIGEPLPLDMATQIFEIVQRVITEEVYEFSLHLARQSLSIDQMVLQLEGLEPVTKLDKALAENIHDDRRLLRKKIIGGIVDYFRQLPPDLEAMLRLIHHNVLINQILNLDPSLIRLQREWFSRRRMYLDTNVVLGYIFRAQKRHQVVKEIVSASLNLSVQLLISPATLDELKRQVDRAKRNHLLAERVAMVKALASYGDDAILATFLQLQREQPSLDWDAFIVPFDQLGDTLLQYNILVEDEGFNNVSSYPKIDVIRKAMVDSKSPSVSEKVIDHDTLNCALILHLRQRYPADERGQIVWLLTIDNSLRQAQRILHGSGHVQQPYSIQAADWGEIVLPAQNILGLVFNDFIGYLAQARLGAIAEPQIIQLDFLETIHDATVDVERLWRLHPQQVRDTLSRLQANREARSLLTNVARTQNDAERKVYQLQFQEFLDRAIEETDPVKRITEEYDRKIDILQKRIELQSGEIADLGKRVSHAESSIGFRFVTWLRKLIRQR